MTVLPHIFRHTNRYTLKDSYFRNSEKVQDGKPTRKRDIFSFKDLAFLIIQNVLLAKN